MRHATLRRWKRDAVEIEWDHKPDVDYRAKLLVQQARRVALLIDELTSLQILCDKTEKIISTDT